MRIITLKNIHILVLLFTMIGGSTVNAIEVAFNKTIKGHKIVVERIEIPYSPPTEEEKHELAKTNPGARFSDVKPDRVGKYSLFLVTPGEKKRRLLWQKIAPEFLKIGGRILPSFRIVDVVFDGENTLVIYNPSMVLVADVVTPALPFNINLFNPDRVLMQESYDTGPVIASTEIQGSLKSNNLTVLAKDTRGNIHRFLWLKRKWVEQKTTQAKLLFTKPYGLDGKKWHLTLNVDPTASKTEMFEGGRESIYKGISVSLQQVPLLPDEQADANNAISLRQSFAIFNPVEPSRWWSGDAAIDEKARKAYVALADGSRFWIQVIELDDVQKELPLATGVSQPIVESLVKQKDSIIEPDATLTKSLPFITSISISKVGNNLLVDFNGKKQESQWSYSLADKRWGQIVS